MCGEKVIWAWSLPNGISCSLDTEISLLYPHPVVWGYISRLFPMVMRKMPRCEILERNIQIDHIHLIMIVPLKYAVSEVIGEIKQYTSGKIRGKFSWLAEVYWKERVIWLPRYFVSKVWLNEKQITEYVRWQGHRIQVKLSLTCKVPRA